jgi:predicted Zn-ribbon and HTH transcriptional regulator
MTRREEMEQLLKERPWTPKELADHFGADINEIVEDLAHVKRSVRPPLKFKFQPSRCRSCGFMFEERSKLKTPSKCPRCKGESIDDARFFIRQEG